MHAHSPASIRLMMALTPKRLFLSLCISISLLRSYTFFSRSPLVSKTVYLKISLREGAPGVTRDHSIPTRIAGRQVSLRPTLMFLPSICLWEQKVILDLIDREVVHSVPQVRRDCAFSVTCVKSDGLCDPCGQRMQDFFQSFVWFGWSRVKATAIKVCSILNNLQMDCSFRHNLLLSDFFFGTFLYAQCNDNHRG